MQIKIAFAFTSNKYFSSVYIIYVTVVTLQALSYDVHERPSTSR